MATRRPARSSTTKVGGPSSDTTPYRSSSRRCAVPRRPRIAADLSAGLAGTWPFVHRVHRWPRGGRFGRDTSNVPRPSCVWIGTMRVATASSSLDRRAARLGSRVDAGDNGAAWFDALGRAQLDRAYRLAGLILGTASEAEDATQEALLRAWRQRRSLRDPNRAQAWFDRILVNACRDQLRRRRPVVRWSDVEAGAVNPAVDPFAALHAQTPSFAGSARYRLTTASSSSFGTGLTSRSRQSPTASACPSGP